MPLTDIVCPACQRPLSEGMESAARCPACGHDFSLAPPKPGWVAKGIDLRMVARRQRLLIWFVLAAIGLSCSPLLTLGLHPGFGLILAGGHLIVLLLVVVGVVQMLAALRTHILVRIIYIVFLIAPCINILTLLVANRQATRALKKAGLHVGFMGVKDEEITRLLGPYRCRRCGYSLIGNMSGRCPECGALTDVAPSKPHSE